jgi:hypothetical protein
MNRNDHLNGGGGADVASPTDHREPTVTIARHVYQLPVVQEMPLASTDPSAEWSRHKPAAEVSAK